MSNSRYILRAKENNQVVGTGDDGLTPEKAIPSSSGGSVTTKNLIYENIKRACLSSGSLFEDPDFPANDSSIYFKEAPSFQIEWLRPHQICSNPMFVESGASRFDIRQGALGDCWLLAAVASLTQHQDLFQQVVPLDQSFDNEYTGCFRFIFWNFGYWKEIVVDDRLPCRNGQLVYMRSQDRNEFWSALLEKAYAKLNGSYESLKGGTTVEALEDFTAGIGEMYELRDKQPENLLQLMLQAQSKSSLMACSIDANPNVTEARLDNGLVMGHAYSITGVEMASGPEGQVALIRIRNPWGNNVEWKGAFCDGSEAWNYVDESERERLTLNFKDDGEFWMAFQDFTKEFQKLEICHLGPNSISETGKGGATGKITDFDNDGVLGTKGCIWEAFQEHSSWKARVNAGGCRNFLNTFWTNPQFIVDLQSPDEDGDLATLIVGLMQKDRRALRKTGASLLTVGYAIYKVDDNYTGLLDIDFFQRTGNAARSYTFINLREITGRHLLPPGKYVIVPSTFNPNEEGDFMLRVFSEKKHDHAEVDEDNHMNKPKDDVVPAPTNANFLAGLERSFKQVAGVDGEIDASELLQIINAAFSTQTRGKGFSLETSRSLIAMMDVDRSGKLTFEEFHELWETLRVWKTAFGRLDEGGTGVIDTIKMRQTLKLVGYSVSNELFSNLALRFSQKDGSVQFDDFIMISARLRTIFEIYKSKNKAMDDGTTITFDENEFLESVLYL